MHRLTNVQVRKALFTFTTRSALLFLVVIAIALNVQTSQAQSNSVFVPLGVDINAFIGNYPQGTTFRIQSGIHYEQSITPRNGDVFIGEDGAVISGARRLTSFSRQGNLWYAGGQRQQNPTNGQCVEGYERCIYPEDLFFDNQPLRHVTSLNQVGPGSWFFDYPNDRIYFYDDPNGHIVETSVIQYAFTGTRSNVVIRNLTVEKYANRAQKAAIQGDSTTNWIIDGLTIQWNHGTGIRIGNGMQVLNSLIINNGQMGIGGIGNDALVEGNEIAYNNYANFLAEWEAGATKFVMTNRLVMRNNYVHHNNGYGLWADIDNINTLYEDNLIVHNRRMGIFHEISYAATIRRNTVMFNSTTAYPWVSGGQIQISNSPNVEVYDNTVVVSAEGGNGITVTHEDRGTGAYGPRVSYNNYVHHNTIIYLGTTGRSGADANWNESTFWSQHNNRFDYNTYFVANLSDDYWEWDDRGGWSFIRSQGQERNGTISGSIPSYAYAVPEWDNGVINAPSQPVPSQPAPSQPAPSQPAPSQPIEGTISALTLINADTGAEMGTLADGDVLNLANMSTHNLNIRADVSSSSFRSVEFQLNGQSRVENSAPYALWGDNNGTFSAWNPALGAYTLVVTPYSNHDAAGVAGSAVTVSFTVIEQAAQQHQLIVDVVGQGNVQVSPERARYEAGTSVQLTAVADAGWTFVGWSNGGTDSNSARVSFSHDASHAITIEADTHIMAVFTNERAQNGTGTGLAGYYFNDRNAETFSLMRIDPTVNFNWTTASPAQGIDANTFLVVWEGWVEARYDGDYTFYTTADDGVRLYVNSELVVDDWSDHSVRESSGIVRNMVAGQQYPIRLEYYENKGNATVVLEWSSALELRSIVPQSQLYPLIKQNPVEEQPTVVAPTNTPLPTNTPIQPTNTPLPAATNIRATAQPSTPISVTHLELMNADTDQVIMTLENGMTLNLRELPTRNLSIVAHTDPDQVGSVMMTLNNETRVENGAPYAIMGNDGNDFYGWTPSVGQYTISAIPYAQSSVRGQQGQGLTITITVIDQALVTNTPVPPTSVPEPVYFASVVEFTLINADNERSIQTIADGAVLNLATLPTRNFNVVAHTNPATVGSVVLSLNGNNRIETGAPYTLAGDDNGDYYAWTPAVGTYVISATPFTQGRGRGEAGRTSTITIQVINQAPATNTPAPTNTPRATNTPLPTNTPRATNTPLPTPRATNTIVPPTAVPWRADVVSFNLINADTNQVINTITTGAVIDLSTLPTRNLNIQAITSGSVGSVVLNLNGSSRTENGAPYALMGDTNGDYTAWTPTAGSYTISATPYEYGSAQGRVGTTMNATFTILDVVRHSLNIQVVGSGSVLRNITQTVYDHGSVVQLTVLPNAGWQFSTWSGDATGNAMTVSVTMNSNKNIVATFINMPPGIAIDPIGPSTGNGLVGEYYDTIDFTGTPVIRTDSTVDFHWVNEPITGFGSDTFSIRWTGWVMPLYSEIYTFTTNSDDGVRLWVNNTLLFEDWTSHSMLPNSASIQLQAGQLYSIRLEYFDDAGSADIQLMWDSGSQLPEIIPATQLFPTRDAVMNGVVVIAPAPAVPVRSLMASLTLTSICAGTWNINNPNSTPVSYTWEITGSGVRSAVLQAQPGINVLNTTPVAGIQESVTIYFDLGEGAGEMIVASFSLIDACP